MEEIETRGPHRYEKMSCGYRITVVKSDEKEWLSTDEVHYIERQMDKLFFGLDKLNKIRAKG